MKDTGKKDGNGEEEEEPEGEEDSLKSQKSASLQESSTSMTAITPLPSNLNEILWSDPNSTLRELGFKLSSRSGKLFHVTTRRMFSWRKFLQLKPGETLVELLSHRTPAEIEFLKRKISTLLTAFRVELNKRLTGRYKLHCYYLKCLDFSDSSDRFLASHDALENAFGLVVFFTANGMAGLWDKKLVLQEGLEVGSLEPYIDRFRQFNWSVVVMDPRSRSDTYLEGFDDIHTDDQALAHVNIIWEKFVLKSKSKYLAIVAEGPGGYLAQEVVRRHVMSCPRLKAIVLMNYTLEYSPDDAWWQTAQPLTRCFVQSARPPGALEKRRNGLNCSSSGIRTDRHHSLVPRASLAAIVEFIYYEFYGISLRLAIDYDYDT